MPTPRTGRARMSLADRFAQKVEPEPNTGCWLWTAGIEDGYGRFQVNKRAHGAHRISWEMHVGPIPSGLHLDHMCRVRCCVNPAHLRLVTPAVNATENSLSFAAVNAAKTCCPKCGGQFVRHSVGSGRIARRCLRCRRQYAAWLARGEEER